MAAKKTKKKNPNMKEVFKGTAADDAAEAKLGEAAKTIKQTHLLSKESTNRLGVCRMSTSSTESIRHDLKRVVEISKLLGDSAREALKQLGQ